MESIEPHHKRPESTGVPDLRTYSLIYDSGRMTSQKRNLKLRYGQGCLHSWRLLALGMASSIACSIGISPRSISAATQNFQVKQG